MQPFRYALDILFQRLAGLVFSPRTISVMRFDLVRLLTRIKRYGDKDITPIRNRLHIGCGWKFVRGWLNVDVRHSECDVDLASGKLPWPCDCFEAVVSQHVIEHLELMTECLPLMCELQRVLRPGGEIWLSCPDIEKICRSYLEFQMEDLLADRIERWPHYSMGDVPTSHMINDLFHQDGEHKNLFDFALLAWMLERAGFREIKRVDETDLLARFPKFPPRHDDKQSIYVRAVA